MKFVLTLFTIVVCTLFSVNAETYTVNNPYQQFQVNPIRSNSYYYSKQKDNNNTIVKPGARTPKRVKGYTSEGDSIDTEGKVGNPTNMWETGYSYYYYNGHWYRCDENGWQQWSTLLGFGWFGWGWYGTSNPGSNAVQYYEYNPTPLGDELFVLLTFSIFYILIKKKLKNGKE